VSPPVQKAADFRGRRSLIPGPAAPGEGM